MTDCRLNTTLEILPDDILQTCSNQVLNASTALNQRSTETYEKKLALIEKASDMSTLEKLDAMDKCYDCHRQEIWQTCGMYILLILAMCGVGCATPSIITHLCAASGNRANAPTVAPKTDT